MQILIKEVLQGKLIDKNLIVKGWVRTFRNSMFIALNDGSTASNLQCVVDSEKTDESIIRKITTGACLELSGKLVESHGKGQSVELQVEDCTVLGESDAEKFPIQPKKHSLEFLREKAHLRTRTNTFGAVMRIRAALSFAVHKYFSSRDFFMLHAPIITGSDAEGAGEMFSVTGFDLNEVPKGSDGNIDFENDFFGKKTNLTVSGQLEAESYALSLGKVYTFGPTFRAENSNTSRHLAEFWMIEPEMAFYDINDNMDLAEDFIKEVVKEVLDNSIDDIKILEDRLEKEEKNLPERLRSSNKLIEKLTETVNSEFVRVTYDEAFDILRNSKMNKKKKFDFLIEEWGMDFQSEHERYLVEKHFEKPVIIYNYPAKTKAFYMRLNDDGRTVAAMDVLIPGMGELVGGSQREERLDVLEKRMEEFNVDKKELWWYLELRKFGTAPHSGFGLGFERLVSFVTGMQNVRDTIPFPRTPKNAEF